MGVKVNIGDVFGEWEVIGEVKNYKVLCRCSCGKERSVNIYTLTSGRSTSCGHTMNQDRVIDLKGQKFGMLTPIEYVGGGYWKCKCDCGNTANKQRSHLLDGRAVSCGCKTAKPNNLKRQRFGKLTVTEYVGNKRWLCKCDCGNMKIVRSMNLVNGSTLSCGCMHFHGDREEIINAIDNYTEKYGREPSVHALAKIFELSYNGIMYHLNKYDDIRDRLYHSYRSRFESEIVQELINMGIDKSDILHNKTGIAGNYEVDIYIKSKAIGIEFNGTYWHSDTHKDELYHQRKMLEFLKNGVKLINIFEYEWENEEKRKKIIDILKIRIAGADKIYHARDLVVSTIDNGEAKEFCNENHLNNGIDSSYNIGLKTKDGELLGVMTFGKSRFKEDAIEMYRMAFKSGCIVVGGANKMFKYFIDTNKSIKYIVSYCDVSKFSGESYIRLGFKAVKLTKPGYVWANGDDIISRFNTQKHKLVESGVGTEDESEDTIMKRLGYMKVYGCGNLRLEWHRE